MNDRRGFGLRIKAARENSDLTLEKASELCDASESIWKQYERGDRLPSIEKLIKICNVLRVKPEYLFGPELDEMLQELDEINQTKLMIDQLTHDEFAVIQAAVSKQLEVRNDDK